MRRKRSYTRGNLPAPDDDVRPESWSRNSRSRHLVPVFRLRRIASHSWHAIAIFDNRRIVAVINRGSAAPRCDGHVCAHVRSGDILPRWGDIPRRYSYVQGGVFLTATREWSFLADDRPRKIRDLYIPGLVILWSIHTRGVSRRRIVPQIKFDCDIGMIPLI